MQGDCLCYVSLVNWLYVLYKEQQSKDKIMNEWMTNVYLLSFTSLQEANRGAKIGFLGSFCYSFC